MPVPTSSPSYEQSRNVLLSLRSALKVKFCEPLVSNLFWWVQPFVSIAILHFIN
jgi:hypothetical protein